MHACLHADTLTYTHIDIVHTNPYAHKHMYKHIHTDKHKHSPIHNQTQTIIYIHIRLAVPQIAQRFDKTVDQLISKSIGQLTKL